MNGTTRLNLINTYTFWVHAYRADDLPGVWLAHVLDIDTVTQGSSLRDALEHAVDAATIVVGEDRAASRDLADRKAPEEFWEKLRSLFKEGFFVRSAEQLLDHQDAIVELATQISITYGTVIADHDPVNADSIPNFWLKETLGQLHS
ncbi:MAG: hypothetical protein AMXMBFR64_57550 [Myxococcales bacterium]